VSVTCFSIGLKTKLQQVLSYAKWSTFSNVIDKAKNTCKNSDYNLLDHVGSTELAANLFRSTQTDEKLRREKIEGNE
jgi:hypothetical protein